MPVQEGTKLTIIQPDDCHLHLRDGHILPLALSHTARCFGRAIIMPNLSPPIICVEDAQRYRERILEVLSSKKGDVMFTPLMTLFLCKETTKEQIKVAKECGFISGMKLYPAGVTTHSERGVEDLKALYPVFTEMEKEKLPLLLHAEVNDTEVDVFDRESVFIERHLEKIVKEFPELKIVFEHVSTKEAVDFVTSHSSYVVATITVHHLVWNRNALFEKGIRPHRYCLPLLKTEKDRLSLIQAATNKSKKFFLGTDSAPHTQEQKESHCGCAGIYSAPCALELYAEVFDKEDALDALENFSSRNGALFYGKELNTKKVTLIKKKHSIPKTYPIFTNKDMKTEVLVPLYAGKEVEWSLLSPT